MSNDSGTVEIRWHVSQGDMPHRLHFAWKERGGPKVREPEETGFGSTVLNDLIPGMLDGDITSIYDPAGFEWRLACDPDALQRG
jgi:two-component sensor histidine kinase